MEYAKGVTDGSRRLADMMTNILKLNRLENQQIYPQATEFNLGEQLCECLLQFENIWEKKNIEIRSWILCQNRILRWGIIYAAIFTVLLMGFYGPGIGASDFVYMQF